MSELSQDCRRTPLYEAHLEVGARMVPFSGWCMPVQYSGIIEEHIHTRTKTGLFDICHMGEFTLKGPSAAQELESLVTCRVDDMPDGKCRYGFLLNEKGGIIDDLIVFRVSREEFMLVVNAGTIEKDKLWIKQHISPSLYFSDESDRTAKLDIQGPSSADVLSKFTKLGLIAGIKRYSFTRGKVGDVDTLISRTGYTGELGYEIYFNASHAREIWELLLKNPDVKPIGLGARDTLRMEMGYSLYGSDIDEEHTPLEANLARFVNMSKDFIGKAALMKQEKEGVKRVLSGFLCEGRRSARGHFDVLVNGNKAGMVTSGSFSPCLKRGIGLCYIEKKFASERAEIILSDGKTEIKGNLNSIPLFEHGAVCS